VYQLVSFAAALATWAHVAVEATRAHDVPYYGSPVAHTLMHPRELSLRGLATRSVDAGPRADDNDIVAWVVSRCPLWVVVRVVGLLCGRRLGPLCFRFASCRRRVVC
jgi:hypothetical protein